MNLIFAKLFEKYLSKNHPAEFTITLLISFFYFVIFCFFFIPINEYISKKYFDNERFLQKGQLIFLISAVYIIILTFVYIKYIRKKFIYELKNKFKDRKISNIFLNTFLILFFPTVLILSGILTVILVGGKILGLQFNGLL
ncbi:hypothetical protein [Epilithonimonas sp.]|uniref:hypothetical protein n=1 Tax=Epilithonimonas sp. TaxID=2894511 RepID=UPI00289E1CE5|nr:hypothetical protein [Epilithonimonas sp.]